MEDEELPCGTLEIDAFLAEHIQEFLVSTRQANQASRRFLTALNERARIPVTFDSEYARSHPNVEFITMRHPLTRVAEKYWRDRVPAGIPATCVCIEGPAEEVGEGYFYLYRLDIQGARAETRLESVVVLDGGRIAERTAKGLLERIRYPCGASGDLVIDPTAWGEAQKVADSLVGRLRDEVQRESERRNEALVAARTTSCRTTFEAKIARTEHLLMGARDERIRRMRESQLERLKAQMNAKLAELEEKRSVSVGYSLLGGGRIRIVPAQLSDRSN